MSNWLSKSSLKPEILTKNGLKMLLLHYNFQIYLGAGPPTPPHTLAAHAASITLSAFYTLPSFQVLGVQPWFWNF